MEIWSELLKGLIVVVTPLLVFTIIYRQVLRQRAVRQAAQYEVLLKLAEMGAPVPPGLLEHAPNTSNADLRRGLILVCGGAGLSAFLLTLPEQTAWGIGLVPISAGIGYLLSWKLARAG